MPGHAELLRAAFGHPDADPADLTGHRIALRHPPIPTHLILSCELPRR